MPCFTARSSRVFFQRRICAQLRFCHIADFTPDSLAKIGKSKNNRRCATDTSATLRALAPSLEIRNDQMMTLFASEKNAQPPLETVQPFVAIMSIDINQLAASSLMQALSESMSTANLPSLSPGLASNQSPDTDALVAAVVNNVAKQESDASILGGVQPSQVAESALASMPTISPGETVPGRVTKPRARKSPGSGAKRSEPSKRKFICSFSHYGCDVALSSKNEWKRHVSIQHLQLGFYRCDVGSCNPDNNPNTPPHKKVYNDFNRKDLFTQHHRRMHKPDSIPNTNSANPDPNSSDWRAFEDSLEEVRARCWQEKRKPPQRATCGFCGRVFEGEGSWNERMEHVGSHYARDLPEASKEEREDEDLTNWSIAQGIIKEAPNGRHVLIDQPVASTDRPYNTRSSNIDMSMSEAPPISPINGQMDNQFIGADTPHRRGFQQTAYQPANGSGRPGSSSGQYYSLYHDSRRISMRMLFNYLLHVLIKFVADSFLCTDRLEDLINTLINPRKPRMSKRLQWRCVSAVVN